VVAALLDLQKGAAFALEAVDEVRRGFDRIGERGVLWQIALRQQLRLIVEYAVDFGQRGIAFRRQMGGTTRYDDSRLGVLSARAAHDSGATLVAIADAITAPMAEGADHLLLYEAAASPGFFPSLTGAIAIAQSLAAVTFVLGGASAKRRLGETEGRLAAVSQYVAEEG